MDENVHMCVEDVAWARNGVDMTTVDINSVDDDYNREDMD